MTSGSEATRTGADVRVRYWASARAAAGCDSEVFTEDSFAGGLLSGRTVGDVLSAAAAAHTGLGAVLEVSTILLDGRQVAASEPLPESLPGPSSESTLLEVLPPFAGG